MVYSSAPLLFYNNYTKFNQSTRHFLFNCVWPIYVVLTWIQSCDALEAEDTQSLHEWAILVLKPKFRCSESQYLIHTIAALYIVQNNTPFTTSFRLCHYVRDLLIKYERSQQRIPTINMHQYFHKKKATMYIIGMGFKMRICLLYTIYF